jgi:uncharacterized protein
MAALTDIGIALVRARKARGLTQRLLAELLGVKQPQIARWESTGYRTASLERLNAVAEALGFGFGPETLVAGEAPAVDAVLSSGVEDDAIAALAKLGVRPEHLAAFARSHGISRLELFGSVLGDGFSPTSDVDVLVTYTPELAPSLIGAADHEIELSAMLRRPVDLVTRASIETSENRARRESILGSARTVYLA